MTHNRNVLGWLAHGGELARDLKSDRAKHSDVIWQLLVESVDVTDKLPDQERNWLTSGKRSGWNAVGMSRAELLELERVRFLTGMKPYDGEARYAPQRNDIDRAFGVLEWLRWCNSAKNADRLTKSAISLARGGDNHLVCALYCPGRKPHRQIAYEIKSRVTGLVLTGLKRDLGVVPGTGISFVSVANDNTITAVKSAG